jgi:hypothetical protein
MARNVPEPPRGRRSHATAGTSPIAAVDPALRPHADVTYLAARRWGVDDEHGEHLRPHQLREQARRARWADGGLASTVVGWDSGRQVATDEVPRRHGRWARVGTALGAVFALVLGAGMAGSALGVVGPSAGGAGGGTTSSPPPSVTAVPADAPELRLVVADGVEPTDEARHTYTSALDAAESSCGQPRDDVAEVALSVADTARRFDAALSGLEVLEELPDASAGAPALDCSELAADILQERFG